MRAIELLSASIDPADRNYAAVLRGQVALINGLVATQARIDEAQLRSREDRDADVREMLELVRKERAEQPLARAGARSGHSLIAARSRLVLGSGVAA